MTQHEDKTIDAGSTNRLAIFCFYDAAGHADAYVRTFLDGLVPYVKRLVIVSNGHVDAETCDMFAQFTPHVIERENKGLDAAAYRQVLLSIGWDQLERFDEVICCNDTCFGPVYPFEEMFDAMAKRPVDFWGVTAHADEIDPGLPKPIPAHIQAYWHAYRHSLVVSPAFHEYWENLVVPDGYVQNTLTHEIPFTKHFADLGFTWDTYVDYHKYEPFTPYALLDMPMQVVRDDHCPLVKRRVFRTPLMSALKHTAGRGAKELYDYLFRHTDYDTSLIWDSLLRTENVADLQQTLHLDYVLPSRASNPHAYECGKKRPRPVRSAFIYHIFFLDMLDDTLRYFANIPEKTDAYITTNADKIDAIRAALDSHGITRPVTFIPVENRGRDVSALLVASRDVVLSGKYDVIGFAHDKKSAQNTAELGRAGTEALGFENKLMENTLGSEEYVRNILTLFTDNERLGLLSPPVPTHSVYFHVTRPTDWGPNFNATGALLDKLGVHVPIDPRKRTVSAIGSCYWFRVDALRPLFEYGWTYADFLPEGQMSGDGTISHAIERANGYVAQSRGYYPAWVMTDDYARTEVGMLDTILTEMMGAMPAHSIGTTPSGIVLHQHLPLRVVDSGYAIASTGANWIWSHSVGKLPDAISAPLNRKKATVDARISVVLHSARDMALSVYRRLRNSRH